MSFVPFSQRPVVIKTHGKYVTRDGSTVIIADLVGKGDFKARGSVTESKTQRRGSGVWHPCGAYSAMGAHPLDIVGTKN